MKRSPLLCLLLLAGCDPAMANDRYDDASKPACAMADGESGCTVNWAFNGNYDVFPRCRPPGTIDTPISRAGDSLYFKGRKISRAEWGCDDPVQGQDKSIANYGTQDVVGDSEELNKMCKLKQIHGRTCMVCAFPIACSPFGTHAGSVTCDWSKEATGDE